MGHFLTLTDTAACEAEHAVVPVVATDASTALSPAALKLTEGGVPALPTKQGRRKYVVLTRRLLIGAEEAVHESEYAWWSQPSDTCEED